MPWGEHATLASAILAPGVHDASDFMDDGAGRAGILHMAGQGQAQQYRGRTVLLAMPRQRDTLAALTALDGVARRVILWPQDRDGRDIEAVASAASADAVLTEWTGAQAPQSFLGGPAQTVQTAWILFTSGTTGRPKMIVHTLESLGGHIRAGTAPRPVWCTFYDTRRYGGLQVALRALLGGGSLVLSEPAESMTAFLARAARADVTHVLGTPSHWRLALMAGAQDIITPTYVRLSGEIADQTILDLLRRAFPQAALVHAFASTEAGLAFEVDDGNAGFPQALLNRGGGAPDVSVSGGVLKIRSARGAAGVLDGDLRPLADEDGFISTGDAVTLLGGRYHFAGRQDGVVNVGGQKVFPEEVEAVINQHPSVRMSRVSARRNAIMGAVVSAEIVRRDGVTDSAASALPQDVIRFCRAHLPAHKVPVSVRLVPSLEVAPSGKLVRLRA